MRSSYYSSSLSILAICIIIGLFGYALRGSAGLNQVTLYLIFGLFAMSVDLLWGYSGLLSFGQAVYFGLGAFCYAWVRLGTFGFIPLQDNSSIIGLIAAIIIPVLLSLVVGYFLFYGKIGGASFTVVTLVLSFLLSMLALGWRTVFGGYTGFSGVPPIEISIGSISISATGGLADFIIISVICAGVALLFNIILKLPFGLIIDGLNDNEERLGFLGVNTAKIKLLVFMIAAAFAGMAGSFYASHTNYVSYHLLGVVLSTEAIIWVAVGGRRTIVGGFLGALIVRTISYLLSGIALTYWMLFIGALFIIVVLLGSNGIIGLIKTVIERRVHSVTRS